ncbi:MAG: hypothetical protein ACR2L2_05475 [Acidobacteriota bacterium]
MSSRHDVLVRSLEAFFTGRQNALGAQVDQLEKQVANLAQQVRQPLALAESELESIRQSLGTSGDQTSDMLDRLAHSVQRISTQTTEEEILLTLLEESANYATRAALFLCEGEQLRGWRVASPGIPADQIDGISVSTSEDTLLGEACRHGRVVAGPPEMHRGNEIFVQVMGMEVPPEFMAAVPLSLGRKIPAVLYADGDSRDEVSPGALEVLCQIAVQSLKFLMLSAVPLTSQPRYQAPTPAPAPAPVPASVAAPIAVQSQPPVSAPAFQTEPPVKAEPGRSLDADIEVPRPSGHGPIDVLDADLSPVPEAAYEFAPEVEAPSEPAAAPTPYVFPAAEPDVETHEFAPLIEAPAKPAEPAAPPVARVVAPPNEEMERFHADARRFARLLVSELKLYNEQAVGDGRQAHNIYGRLRHDIDRSREMYERRVHTDVATEADYFHEEIVRILADGNASALGSEYPGVSLRKH